VSSLKKLQNNRLLLVIVLLLAMGSWVKAQEPNSTPTKKTYIIGKVEVTGLQSYNEQTVKTFAGFRE
jgi:outer membrane protein insertion porin family